MQAGGALEAWEEDFRDVIEQSVKETTGIGNLAGATDDQLMEGFDAVLTGDKKDQFTVFATKVLESQQEAIEAVANGHFEIPTERGPLSQTFMRFRRTPADIQEQPFIPITRSTNAAGQSEVAGDIHNGGGWLRRFARDPVGFIGNDAPSAQRRSLREAGRLEQHMKHAFFIDDNAIRVDDPLINRPGQPPRHLSDSQKRYLENLQFLGYVPVGERITGKAKEDLEAEATRIVRARMNVYDAHGQLLNGENLNLLQRDPGGAINEAAVSNRVISLARHGLDGVEMRVGHEPNRNAFLETVIQRIRTDTEADVRNSLKEKVTLPIVDDQISILEQQTQPRALVKAETDRIAALSGEKDAYAADRALVDQMRASQGTVANLDREIALLNGQIAPDALVFSNPDANNPNTIAHFERQNRTETTAIAGLEKRIGTANQQLADLRAALRDSKANTAAITPQIDAINQQLNNPGGLEEQLQTARTNNQTTQDEIARRRDVVNQNQALMTELSTKNTQRTEEIRKQADIQSKLNNAKKMDGVTARYPAGASMDVVTAEINNVVKNNETAVATIESSAKPDRFKMRQLEALRTFRDGIAQPTADEDIQNRAAQRVTGIEASMMIQQAERTYPGLNATYLRTMMVLFGERVTSDTADGRELFQRGSQLMTPENFQTLVNSYGGGVIADVEDINPDFINHVIDDMHARARARTLGQMEPAHEQRMRQIETIVPSDIAAERTNLSAEETTALNNYDTQINVRRDQIRGIVNAARALGPPPMDWNDIATRLNDRYFNGEVVYSGTGIEQMANASAATGRNEYQVMMPNRNTLQQLNELIAVDRERESQQLFLAASEQLIADPVLFDQIRDRVQSGENIERVMADPTFFAERENLRRAMNIAHSGNTILAGLAYILTPQRFGQMELGLRQNRSLIESLSGLDPAGQADAVGFIQEIAQLAGGMSLQTIEQNNGVMAAAAARARVRRPALSPGGAIDNTLIRVIEAARGTENRLRLDQVIQRYSRLFPHYEDIDDLTAKIVYDSRLQGNLYYAKMLAQEVIKYREANGTP
jgi:hypothetical protein